MMHRSCVWAGSRQLGLCSVAQKTHPSKSGPVTRWTTAGCHPVTRCIQYGATTNVCWCMWWLHTNYYSLLNSNEIDLWLGIFVTPLLLELALLYLSCVGRLQSLWSFLLKIPFWVKLIWMLFALSWSIWPSMRFDEKVGKRTQMYRLLLKWLSMKNSGGYCVFTAWLI